MREILQAFVDDHYNVLFAILFILMIIKLILHAVIYARCRQVDKTQGYGLGDLLLIIFHPWWECKSKNHMLSISSKVLLVVILTGLTLLLLFAYN